MYFASRKSTERKATFHLLYLDACLDGVFLLRRAFFLMVALTHGQEELLYAFARNWFHPYRLIIILWSQDVAKRWFAHLGTKF